MVRENIVTIRTPQAETPEREAKKKEVGETPTVYGEAQPSTAMLSPLIVSSLP